MRSASNLQRKIRHCGLAKKRAMGAEHVFLETVETEARVATIVVPKCVSKRRNLDSSVDSCHPDRLKLILLRHCSGRAGPDFVLSFSHGPNCVRSILHFLF